MGRNDIVVRTHVARDLLQSAALFKTDKLVVWEYVANALQYTEPGVPPEVRVELDRLGKRIVVIDNGRGMDRSGLQNFFVMHGENLDRKAGRRGRGMFGTGKCAAFGIAESLRVSSVRGGHRNTVELRRSDIEKSAAHEIPVKTVEEDVPTKEANGTIVEIASIRLRSLDQPGIIRYIERHLARWPSKPVVVVGSHLCEPPDPPVSWIERIKNSTNTVSILGDIELVVRVSKVPLEPEMQGINIYANGVWLETTLAGIDGQAMSQYIFGEIDVPALDDDTAPLPAYDMSRSMQLNRSNEVVIQLLAFIGPELDRIRRRLVSEEQARRSEREAKELAREASRIAQLINDDFREFTDRVTKIRAKAARGPDAGPTRVAAGTDADLLTPQGDEIGLPIPRATEPTPPAEGATAHEAGCANPLLEGSPDGNHRGRPAGGTGGERKSHGGFRVDFKAMTAEADRALHVRRERTIYINLDHPQIAAARGSGSIDDPVFRRLAYEVAFSEYAIALASEMAEHDEYKEPSDPIFDIRETTNRMARRAAALYAR